MQPTESSFAALIADPRIKIVDHGDGTWPKIIDAVTGRPIERVQEVAYWRSTGSGGGITIQLTAERDERPEAPVYTTLRYNRNGDLINPNVIDVEIEADATILPVRWVWNPEDRVTVEVPIAPVTAEDIDQAYAAYDANVHPEDRITGYHDRKSDHQRFVEAVTKMLDRRQIYRTRNSSDAE